MCFVSLLCCCYPRAARWKPTALDFPSPGEPPSLPRARPAPALLPALPRESLSHLIPRTALLAGMSWGRAHSPCKKRESIQRKVLQLHTRPDTHPCQTLSERELLLINGKGKLIVIRYKCQGGNSEKIKHRFSTRRKGRFPRCSLSLPLHADEKNIILTGSVGDQDVLAFTIRDRGTGHVTLRCTKLSELFTFLRARSAAGVNHHDGSDFGGTLPIYSSEGFGAEMFPSV